MSLVDLVVVPEIDPQLGLLLAVLEDVTQEWNAELEDVSIEEIVWRAFQGGHSIGGLLLHIADVEAYWIQEVGAGQTRSPEELQELLSEQTQQYELVWPEPPAQPLEWYRQKLAAVRKKTRLLISGWESAEAVGFRENKAGERTEFTRRWLLNHIISHEAYHGGQIVLLKLIQRGRPEDKAL